MKSQKIYLATFSDHPEETIRKYGIGIEFNQFCISTALDPERIDRTLAYMEKQAGECGLLTTEGRIDPDQAVIHGPFTELYPQAIDPEARAFAMRRFNQAYEGCRRLGIRRMVVHSGLAPQIYFDVWHVKQSVIFWKKFMEDKPEDFRLYIENVMDPDPRPLLEIAEKLDDPRIRLCLNIGHANACGLPEFPPAEWVRILGPHIGHFHFHNNDGSSDQHNPITEGSIDISVIMDAIKTYCDPDVTITVESRDCESSVRWLKEREEQKITNG